MQWVSDLLRLGRPLPAVVHPGWRLLSEAAGDGLPVPVGAVLLSPDLGPLRAGEQVDVRSALRRPKPPAPLSTDDQAPLAAALALAWGDGGAGEVLVARAPDAVHAGTARLQPEAGCDEVTAYEVTGVARAVGAGPRELLVPRLRARQRAHRGGDRWRTPLPPWGMRLARLLRAARPRVDGGELEWADDGRRCWLLALHPAAPPAG